MALGSSPRNCRLTGCSFAAPIRPGVPACPASSNSSTKRFATRLTKPIESNRPLTVISAFCWSHPALTLVNCRSIFTALAPRSLTDDYPWRLGTTSRFVTGRWYTTDNARRTPTRSARHSPVDRDTVSPNTGRRAAPLRRSWPPPQRRNPSALLRRRPLGLPSRRRSQRCYASSRSCWPRNIGRGRDRPHRRPLGRVDIAAARCDFAKWSSCERSPHAVADNRSPEIHGRERLPCDVRAPLLPSLGFRDLRDRRAPPLRLYSLRRPSGQHHAGLARPQRQGPGRRLEKHTPVGLILQNGAYGSGG